MNEIITDDVNVEECEFYDDVECNVYCQEYWEPQDNTKDLCKCHPNCYFKQLKRLEAKYKEAALKMTKADTETEKLQAENNRLNEFVKISNQLLNQGEINLVDVVNLRIENERLKKINKLYKKVIIENQQKYNNKIMILKACIKGEINVDDFNNYAKLELENKKLKQENKKN